MVKNSTKKLKPKDFEDMWGDEGPYSEVKLSEQTRILDTVISRVFLVVEVHINPFTFEYVFKNRDKFKDDIPIQQLLDTAVYTDFEHGYLSCAGEFEMVDVDAHVLARQRADMAIATILRMHEFVMDEHGLSKNRLAHLTLE